MKIRGLLIKVVAVLLLLRAVPASGQDAKSAVAIVCAVTGTASVTAPTKQRKTIRLFEWVSAGSVINVAGGSKLTLVFASGARYELGEIAQVTVGATSVTSSSGPVRELDRVAPFHALAPIAESSRAGSEYAAVRIRGTAITHLYPDGGATTLADSTVLRFRPLQDASRYSVELRTANGASVFQVETQSPIVTVSRGVLKPGAMYSWEVRTLDRIPQAARGEAAFATLSAEAAEARSTLRQSLEGADDGPSLALLAEIDRSLGLLIEAREAFRAAITKAPDDDALRQALDSVVRQLAADREKSDR
jgi:hypothetical protein